MISASHGSYRVRAYASRDRADVVALWNLVFAADPPRNAPKSIIDRKVDTQRDLFLVAASRECVVGTVLGGYDGFRGWMYHLAVHPDHRRAGVGRQLVQELEIRLRKLGCPKLNLQVRVQNREVRAFYEHLGYSVEERLSMGKVL